MIFYEDCFPFIGQDKLEHVTVFSIPSSYSIDQSYGVSSKLPTDHIMLVPNNTNSDLLTLEQSFNITRRSLRQTHKSSKYKDFHVSYPSSIVASYFASTWLYPLTSVLSNSRLSPSYDNIILSITLNFEPQSYNEASKDPV